MSKANSSGASRATAKPLTGKDRRALRALGHSLAAAVHVGKAGLRPGVIDELAGALAAHELVKVRVLPECPMDRAEAGEKIAKSTRSELVQTIGKMLLFYKRNPEQTKITLPSLVNERPVAPRSEDNDEAEGAKPARGGRSRYTHEVIETGAEPRHRTRAGAGGFDAGRTAGKRSPAGSRSRATAEPSATSRGEARPYGKRAPGAGSGSYGAPRGPRAAGRDRDTSRYSRSRGSKA